MPAPHTLARDDKLASRQVALRAAGAALQRDVLHAAGRRARDGADLGDAAVEGRLVGRVAARGAGGCAEVARGAEEDADVVRLVDAAIAAHLQHDEGQHSGGRGGRRAGAVNGCGGPAPVMALAARPATCWAML